MADAQAPPDFVLIKNLELHGDLDHVQPSRVPYEAWRTLWAERKFVLVDATGKAVDDPADADADPQAQQERAARLATPPKSRAAANKES